jgi:hypothetical protein
MKYIKVFIIIFLIGLSVIGITSLAMAVTSNFSITVNPLIQCNDGLDNDGDSFIDYPDDPECASATDNIEEFQQCEDNYDNDSDGLIDFPLDPGCTDSLDTDETNVYQCNDGLDNDSDSKIDYPLDPGCASATDNDETNGQPGYQGNGGPSGFVIEPVTSMTFSGWAYPNQLVTLLKDGQIFIQTIAGPDAKFYVNLTGLTPGNYNFSFYSEDTAGRRSTLYTFPVFVSEGASTQVSGIFIAPTIMTDLLQVKRGENLAIFGQTTPNSNLTIIVESENKIVVDTNSDATGVYLINFDSSQLAKGDHIAKSRVMLANEVSSFSSSLVFKVGDINVVRGSQICSFQRADLNCDAKVNLVDFSIAAYWYQKVISAEFAELERTQLNGDYKIDLTDFSIMAYYWSG